MQLQKFANSQLDNVRDHVVSWIKQQAYDAKRDGIVIPVSGGIDSAVVSVLCALTGLRVYAITIPIETSEESARLAKLQMDYLKRFPTTVLEVDLTNSYHQFNTELSTLELAPSNDVLKLAQANLKSRMRMSTAYFVAGLTGSLVIGTGNYIEDTICGFCTKYGDHGVDMSPIGEFTKEQVYQLARVLGIPKEIQEAAPTDGLWLDGRTDEDQLGMTYDDIMFMLQQEEKSRSEGLLGAMVKFEDPSFQDKYSNLVERRSGNMHKLSMPPICHLHLDFYS